jgi:hypothetical protein
MARIRNQLAAQLEQDVDDKTEKKKHKKEKKEKKSKKDKKEKKDRDRDDSNKEKRQSRRHDSESEEPAMVVTRPADVEIMRMAWWLVSTTKTVPDVSTATPFGLLNRATARGPSMRLLSVFEPASVVTNPVDDIWRMAQLYVSATYRVPSVVMAKPLGLLNVAAVP